MTSPPRILSLSLTHTHTFSLSLSLSLNQICKNLSLWVRVFSESLIWVLKNKKEGRTELTLQELELESLKLEFHVDFSLPQLYQHMELESLRLELQ